jgi:hypothetical protein
VVAALSNHDPQDYSGTRHQARGTRFSSPALPRGASFQPPPTPRGGTFQPPFPSGSGFQPDKAAAPACVVSDYEPLAQACGLPARQYRGLAPRGSPECTRTFRNPYETPSGPIPTGSGLLSDASTATVDGSTEAVDGSTTTVDASIESVDGSTTTADGSTETIDGLTRRVDRPTRTASRPTEPADRPTRTANSPTEPVSPKSASTSVLSGASDTPKPKTTSAAHHGFGFASGSAAPITSERG